MAWYFRSRPPLSEPPADSPSTRKSSQREGSRSWQSASFPGRPLESSADLRRVSSGALGAGCVNALADDAAGDCGVLVKIFAELLVNEGLDDAFDIAIELPFGLAFK